MKRLFTGGRVLSPDGTLRAVPVLVGGDRILAVGDDCKNADADQVVDLAGRLVFPGLVDVHTHGRAGFDFTSSDESGLRRMKDDYARHGVTSVFATLSSATAEDWKAAIRRIESVGFDGIHFEGRYLNPVKRGAHAPELVVPPDAGELDGILSGVHVPCHVTAAYELDPDGSFAAAALSHGATLGLGHTNATAEEAKTALSRGVTSFTHLFNAMPPLHHREGGAVCVALNGDAFAELIVDGVHVCPDMVRLAYRNLGREKLVLITDSLSATGCADGVYESAGLSYTVRSGRAYTDGGVLAGSTLNLLDGVKNLARFAGIPLPEAAVCATATPARMVGIDGEVGSVAPGKRADLLFLDGDGSLLGVLSRGEDLPPLIFSLKGEPL